jgi:hypothetical protein
MAGTSLKSIIFGLIAGAIATVTIHELINYGLLQAGVFPRVPWSLDPVDVKVGSVVYAQIPRLVSDALWGGLWGVIFALVLGDAPRGSMTFKGALLGILGPALVGVFILFPMMTGRFPMFFGGDFGLVGSVLLILAGFGAATAWLYGFFSHGCRLP